MKKSIIAIGLALYFLIYNSIPVLALPVDQTIVETNEIPNWPIGPELNCKSAILIEANTGVILYAKNPNERLYPASTTKLLTTLLAAENSDMDEIVTFSYDSVFSLEEGSSNIGIDPGQAMDMEECLYGIMVGSANEVANAVAEHVGGSIEGFVNIMNQRVSDLGLKNTHFTNPNGLQDENHYTSAYDLAIIAREYFKDEHLSKIGNTALYHFEATSTQPDDFYIRNKHKLINGDISYPGIKGGKTGFTSDANETLVTCSDQDGMRLICVVLYEDSPEQFYDTVKLFDYGFSNFTIMNVAENEKRYSIKSSNFFPTSVDILGDSSQILELNKDSYIIMPRNITFNDLETSINYNTDDESDIAYITYSYSNAYLGYGRLNKVGSVLNTSAFDPELVQEKKEEVVEEDNYIYINVVYVIAGILIVAFVISIITIILSVLINYNILDNMHEKRKSKRRIRRDKSNLKF